MTTEISANQYSEIPAKKVDWLWYPYIAYGKITLLEGDPGDGKSTFILQLAALLTTGKKLPDGTKGKRPINVIYQCTEDDPSDTIKPRLLKAGANCERVLYFPNEPDLALDDNRLPAAITKLNAKLVIFDPIQSFIPKDADMLNAIKMRSVMATLAKTAEQCRCAIVLVGHLNKDVGGKNIYRGLGSIDIAAVARSILLIARDSQSSSKRIMMQIKNNLGPEGADISFEFSDINGIVWHGCISAEGEQCQEDIVSPAEKAKLAMRSLLAEKDVKSTDIMEHIKSLGISERTAKRAKSELGIETYKRGRSWYWHLNTGKTGM